MPAIRRKGNARRREWKRSHFLQLISGSDFTGSAWGDRIRLDMDRRHEWPGVEVLDDMRQCWLQHREEIETEAASRFSGDPIWAELVFGEGKSIDEAFYLTSFFAKYPELEPNGGGE